MALVIAASTERTFSTTLKDAIARSAIRPAGWYFRIFPYIRGNRLIYEKIVARHICWRSFDVWARTAFGARMRVNTADLIGRYLCFFGLWEPFISRYVAATLRPGDIFVDVGANIGYYTLLASDRVGPDGRVYAIEASPTIYERLRSNVMANRRTNVEARNVAAMAETGVVPIYLAGPLNVGNSTVIPEVTDESHRLEAPVECKSLVDIVPLADLRQARMIKIDVEGAEWLVLQGLRSMLGTLSDRCEVLMEINADAVTATGGSIDALQEIFRGEGFRGYVIENSYQINEYTLPAEQTTAPPLALGFSQVDVIFRREGAPTVYRSAGRSSLRARLRFQ